MIRLAGLPGSTTMPIEQRYEQLAADLERRIREGEFPPGSSMPSRSRLRVEYAHLAVGAERLSQSVIDKAMMILRAKGLIETQPGVAVLVKDPLPEP